MADFARISQVDLLRMSSPTMSHFKQKLSILESRHEIPISDWLIILRSCGTPLSDMPWPSSADRAAGGRAGLHVGAGVQERADGATWRHVAAEHAGVRLSEHERYHRLPADQRGRLSPRPL